jgi:excisionase family DNA binding protein
VMPLDLDPAGVALCDIPATLTALAALQTALAARLMAALPALTPAAPATVDKMLTVKEVAERLRCSIKTVYRRVEKHEFPFACHNGSRGWIFSEQGLTKWLACQRT